VWQERSPPTSHSIEKPAFAIFSSARVSTGIRFCLTWFSFCSAAGLVATFLVEPKNSKGAFMAGISWQGLVGGVLAGRELKTVKGAAAARRAKKGRPG
jgi:hypothetical protein